MPEILGTLIAGLGLFFTGVHLVGTHLKQLTSRRFRLLVSKWADNAWLAGLWGALFGAITQSMTALTFIITSLISSGMLTVRKALPVVLWANSGVSVLVSFAVLRVELVVLYLLGASGLSFAFERPLKYRNLVGALFGISLLFYGLNLMRTSAAPISQSEWLRDLLIFIKHSPALAFVAGTVLAIAAHSAAAVSIVAITLMKGGLFDVNQTMMIIYGSNVGSSCITWFLSTGLRGTARQFAMTQVLFNYIGSVVFVPLFYLELYTQTPLVKALVTHLASGTEQQMALVYLMFNLFVSILLSFGLNPYYRLLQRLWPPTLEENESKPAFIYENALTDPETAMDLVAREQLRLVQRMPLYMAGLRTALSARQNFNPSSIHGPFRSVSTEIESFMNELHATDLPKDCNQRFRNLLGRQNLIDSIEENVTRLADSMARSNHSDNLNRLFLNFVEGLDAILLTTADTLENQSERAVDTLITITSDRGGLMDKIRETYLSGEQRLAAEEKSILLYVTNLFELIVWLLRRLAMGLTTPDLSSS